MFDGLPRGGETGVERTFSLVFLHDLLGLVDNAQDRFTGLAARRLAELFEDLLEAFDVSFRFLTMSLESFPQLGRGSGFRHFGQCPKDLLFGEIDVFQGILKEVA
jgi:hypothetical protein